MKRPTGRRLSSAIVGLLLLAAGLPAGAAAADISLPGGEQQPLPTMPPCHESKKVLCTSPAGTAQAATGLAQLTSDPKVRHGLGLPPLRKLFGKHGGAKLRQADARFAKQAGEPLTAETSVARASAGDSLGQSLGADQALHNGDTKQTRTLRIEVSVDQCPNPGPISNSHGDAHILGRANYVVTTSTHSGHYLVTNIVTLEMRLNASALVTRRAELYGILDLGGEDIGITRQTIVRNLRTGKTSHPPLLHTSVHVESMDSAGQVELDLEQFNVWIERQEALKKGEEDPYADFPLVSKSFKTAARTFATYVGARVTEVTREAEKHWKTPNACLKMTLTGPDTLAPSHKARVFGKVAPTSVAAGEEQVYSEPFGAGTYEGDWVHGGSSTTLATLPLHPGMAWEEYKAPASPWTPANKPGLKLTFYSKAGVAQETKLFELGPPPPVEVAFNGTADCDPSHGATQCGEDRLHFDWHGSAELETAGGFPGLELWSLKSGHIDVTITGHLEKCEISGQQSVAMSPGAIDTVSFALLAGTPQTYQLTITLGTETATVTTESCEKEEEEGQTTELPLSAIAYAKTPQPVSRPTPSGPISYSYSGAPDPGDPLYNFQWTITGVE